MSFWEDLLAQTAFGGDIRRERQRQAVNRAAAFFGLAGANPTGQEIAGYAERGGLDPMAGIEVQPGGALKVNDAAFFRDKQLRDALDRNAPAVEAVRQVGALREAGIDPGDLTAQWKLQALQQHFNDPGFTPEQRLSALTGHDISPYKVSGATGYNRYTGAMSPTPLGQADIAWRGEQAQTEQAKRRATDALAGLRGEQAQTEQARQDELGAQTADESLRTQVARDFFNQSDNPMLKMDAANKKPLFKGERVKVKMRDGSIQYYDRTLNPAGGYDYAPAQDAQGGPVLVPPQEYAPNQGTSLQRNAQLYADTYGLTFEQGLQLAAPGTDTHTREKLLKDINAANQEARAKNPYRTKEDVQAAYKAGKLSRDEAKRLLEGLGVK